MNTKENVIGYIRKITNPNHKENLRFEKIQTFIQAQTQRLLNEHLDLEVTWTGGLDNPRKAILALFNEALKLDDDWKIFCWGELTLTGVFKVNFVFKSMHAETPQPENAEPKDPTDAGHDLKMQSSIKLTGRDNANRTPQPHFYNDHDRNQLKWFHQFLTDTFSNEGRGAGLDIAMAGYQVSYNYSPDHLTIVLS